MVMNLTFHKRANERDRIGEDRYKGTIEHNTKVELGLKEKGLSYPMLNETIPYEEWQGYRFSRVRLSFMMSHNAKNVHANRQCAGDPRAQGDEP